MTTVSRIPVTFSGPGSGVGELTWGQRGIRNAQVRTGGALNIGGLMALAPGARAEQLGHLLSFIMGRHQALRTRFRFAADGRGEQAVEESGEAFAEVVDVGDGEDADAVAEQLRSRYEMTPFDNADEWPVRVGAVRRAGELTHAVVMYNHLAVDGDSIAVIVRDLANLDFATGEALAPPAQYLTQLELARLQREPAALRQSDACLRYWERILRSIPARRFGDSGDPREPRYWQLRGTTRALPMALRPVAEQAGAQSGHVLLAAQAIALGRVSGVSPGVMQVLVNNRFRPGFGDSVGNHTQASPIVVETAESTFREVLARTFRTAMAAFKHGYHDSEALERLVEVVNADRGETVEFRCFVNDRRALAGGQAFETGPVPTLAEIQAARAQTAFAFGERSDRYDGPFFMHVDSLVGALALQVWADTHRFTPDDIMAFAHQLEEVLVEALVNLDAPTRVHATVAV